MQHLVFCHVRQVHRHRDISELYSIIGDANAVKEIDFVHKDWYTNLAIVYFVINNRPTGFLSIGNGGCWWKNQDSENSCCGFARENNLESPQR